MAIVEVAKQIREGHRDVKDPLKYFSNMALGIACTFDPRKEPNPFTTLRKTVPF